MKYFSPLNISHEKKYDDNPRKEVVDMISNDPLTILELGCGAGATGELIKKKFPGTNYTGIELDKNASEIAAKRLDRIINGDINQIDLEKEGIKKGSIGLILLLDILEHLYDPWKIVALLRDFLADKGMIIASIPNIQHFQVLDVLINGQFPYQEFGVLDATHIRFFTYSEIVAMFENNNYKIFSVNHVTSGSFNTNDSLVNLDFGKFIIRDVKQSELINFTTVQYIISAGKRN